MRGRIKDRLRAGSVAFLGVYLAGIGCQSQGPLLDLNDGSRARVTSAFPSAAPAPDPGTSGEQTPVVERTGLRGIFPRLLRPRPGTETPTSAEIQSVPPSATPRTVIASTSTWSPVQRQDQPVPSALTPAGWQKDRPMPLPPGTAAPQLDPPGQHKPEKLTPPPTLLEPPTKAKPDSEPALLHAPRPAPVEAAPESVEVGLPHAPGFGPKAPVETGKVSLPPYIIEPPDILLVETLAGTGVQEIKGQHLVRPDGTIGLGIFGPVYVNGMTTEQAREAVAQTINSRLEKGAKKVEAKDINVDVIAYNSKVYYVITDGGGFGEQVRRFPITGSETVLDAISHIDGLPAVASKKRIWVARRTPNDHGTPQIFPVNWIGITQGGQVGTNYQVMPGDRIYVHSQKLVRADSMIGKFLAPFERILGVTLLGSSTVNSIRGRGPGFGGTGF